MDLCVLIQELILECNYSMSIKMRVLSLLFINDLFLKGFNLLNKKTYFLGIVDFAKFR